MYLQVFIYIFIYKKKKGGGGGPITRVPMLWLCAYDRERKRTDLIEEPMLSLWSQMSAKKK